MAYIFAPREAVVRHRLRPSTLAASTIASLYALLGCASAGTSRTSPVELSSGGDTATVRNIDGRTIESLFVGRFAGVTVARTSSGGLQIRIRGGNNSFLGSSEPLYVVDGTPLAGGTGEIAFLNPYDIERIEVLKNAADISLYGIRGANGVIRITTKRPGRQ